MLKINLLPAYVLERQIVKRLLVFLGLVVACEVVGLFMVYGMKAKQLADQKADRDKKVKEQRVVEGIEQEALAITSSIGGQLTTLQFYVDRAKIGPAIAQIYKDIARYTSGKAQITAIQINANQVAVQGSTYTLDDLSALLMNYMRCGSFVPGSVMLTSGPKGYSSGGGAVPAGGLGGMGGPGQMGGGPGPGQMGGGPGPGQMGGPPPGMPGAAGGMGGGAPGGGAAPSGGIPPPPLPFSISFNLANPVSIPGQAAGGAGGGPGMMGGAGPPGGMAGGPGGGGPPAGAMGPGGPSGGPPAGGGGMGPGGPSGGPPGGPGRGGKAGKAT